MINFKFERWAESALSYARQNLDDFEGSPNWVVVRNLFGCGRTAAVQYCEHIHIDPDSESLAKITTTGELEA